MTQQVSTNTFFMAKWIVSPDATQGTHTTISSALTSASSGDTIFVREGTYTEDITLKAGVNITALPGSSLTPTVVIKGEISLTVAGSVTMSHIQLETNSNYLLSVTGTTASKIYFYKCYLNVTNNTAINYSSSSSSALILFYDCSGNISNTGISYFTMSSLGALTFTRGSYTNYGGTTTAATSSNGVINLNWCTWFIPITLTSSANLLSSYSTINTGNTTCLSCSGGGDHYLEYGALYSGTATTLSVNSGATVNMTGPMIISSSAATVVSGTGTLNYTLITFIGTSTTTGGPTTQTPFTTLPAI